MTQPVDMPPVNEFNPFIPFGMEDKALELVLKIGTDEWNSMYKKFALEMHPDKFPSAQRAKATEQFQELHRAREALCSSRQHAIFYMQHWLITSREHVISQRDKEARCQEIQTRQAELSQREQRTEAMPGIVLVQSQLGQALRCNARWQQRKENSAEEVRLAIRKSANELEKIRSRPFKPPEVLKLRGASKEDIEGALKEAAAHISRIRADKKLARVVGKVRVDQALAMATNAKYVGPSTAAWQRRAHGWARAGMHGEFLKKVLARRREKREAKEQAQIAEGYTDKDDDDLDFGGARGSWRKFRRESQQRDTFYCRPVSPPRRCKPSKTRKKQMRANYKNNQMLATTRNIAANCMPAMGSARPLPLTSGCDEGLCAPTNKKPRRRGGKANARKTGVWNAW